MSDERTISIPSITLLYDDDKLISVGIGGEMFVCGRAFRCKMRLRDDLLGHSYQDIYECSECGNQMIMETFMGESEPPNYCPNCGRKVERC